MSVFSFSTYCDGFVALKNGSKCWLVAEGCGKKGGQKDKYDFYRKQWNSGYCVIHWWIKLCLRVWGHINLHRLSCNYLAIEVVILKTILRFLWIFEIAAPIHDYKEVNGNTWSSFSLYQLRSDILYSSKNEM